MPTITAISSMNIATATMMTIAATTTLRKHYHPTNLTPTPMSTPLESMNIPTPQTYTTNTSTRSWSA